MRARLDLDMKLLRRVLILTHRYLGIALGALFVVWFASGIAIMYGRGMPRLTPELRLQLLESLDPTRVRLTAAAAEERAALRRPASQVALLTVLGRPAYRFGTRTVFADTGERLRDIDAAVAREVASRFTRTPVDRLTHARTLNAPDQWTIGQRQFPLHKFHLDDDAATEVYVSAQTADVVVLTTRGSRALAWVGAIPHWMYFTALRTNAAVWRQVVLWTSGVGIVLALLGIVLGFIQLRVTRPFSIARIPTYLPYSGWMRWHYITGLVFGIFTLTFVFSGWLSMEPFFWASGDGRVSAGVREAFATRPGALSEFPAIDGGDWAPLQRDGTIKEIEYVRIQDRPSYIVRRESGRLIVRAETMLRHEEAFASESLLERLQAAVPDSPIVESEMLSAYDSYYYSRDRRAPLPVLRVKMGDPDSTWVYIDPLMSQLVSSVHRLDRVERWIYNGLHSLDFAFWYDKRPVWDIGMIALNLGGLAVSLIGLCLGVKRIRRSVQRARGAYLEDALGARMINAEGVLKK